MKSSLLGKLSLATAVCLASWSVVAQQSAAVSPSSAVPKLVNYSGVLNDLSSKPSSSLAGVTFLLYKEQQGGAPLWMETQNVQPDKTGHFTVTLGATKSEGLPADVFANGEARWLGVQVTGQVEQPRVLLVAVPYAMKAKDAETIGGLPPSAFVLAVPPNNAASATTATGTANGAPATASAPPPATSNVTTAGGTVNAIPLFTTATNIQNSIMTQTAATAVNVAGKLNHPATGTATTVAGKNSQPEDFVASAFNSGTKAALAQTFQLQAEPAGNNTATPSGTLNLLYGSGTAAPAETGLKINNKGLITFATGQMFPGTGKGTVTSVGLTAPASDFSVSGSPVTTTGTLNIAWKVAPTSADTANAIVKRDASGNFSAGTVTAADLKATDATLSDVLSVTSAANNPLFVSTSSSTTPTAVYGTSSASSGIAFGVEGVTSSTSAFAAGVVGDAVATSGSPVGVYGLAASANGVGVFGQNGSESTTGAGITSLLGSGGIGAWGDGGGASTNVGVVGTVDNGFAGVFANNSPSGYDTFFVFSKNSATAFPLFVENANGTFCYIDNSGNLNCTGTKNAVVPIDGGKRRVAMSAIESPQNWFEDFGAGELVNGVAVIALDTDFIQTVNTDLEYHVFLTPNGDCKGLYVSRRTPMSFEVHELSGGASSIGFSYRVVALRRKYEDVRFADRTADIARHQQMMEKLHTRRPQPQAHDPGKKLVPVPTPVRRSMLTGPKVATR